MHSFNKKEGFTLDLADRLKITQIECGDAVKLIVNKDNPETFFYIHPPYLDSNQGHYGGYMQSHFNSLLEALKGIEGKFLLSSYPNAGLALHTTNNGWYSKALDMHLSAANSSKRKVEMLTANYPI